MTALDQATHAGDGGMVFRWARAYDALLWLLWRGNERSYREKVVALARLERDDAVLDVGCGTGTLAISARRRVAPGKVVGVDASAQMVARAISKARRAGADVNFEVARADALPFSDAQFDAALSTTVMHCLSKSSRPGAILEMKRVLKPGGRLLIVDFGGAPQHRHSLVAHMRMHQAFDLEEILPDVQTAGFIGIEAGAVGFSDLSFLSAVRPAL